MIKKKNSIIDKMKTKTIYYSLTLEWAYGIIISTSLFLELNFKQIVFTQKNGLKLFQNYCILKVIVK
jgi:hypothetical protein